MIYTNLTLGELLSSDNPAIKRNAIGILKQIQKTQTIPGWKYHKEIQRILDKEPCEKCHDTQFYYDKETQTMKLCELH